ncbi:ankyrin repeat domain-containing protein [Burkholderia multivorans]|uniref:ankyrin repeat domain-containing protein n=1 Tax=Burkholderia multivorans TaxID=87883 RepID=UPI002019A911|nr:ankyrin repeat domain-containing protein [Burkholderia multivorans]MCA8487250.1 ankyrin repeat domain-containing protein [Burkholderia multivorans]MCL4663314.1 ankyrin repeat domain-containing protein [Burkholderia multivorans]MCO1356818.1 ankyrin repeat domain-containing protein [Burkholderia multivorans]MCO1414974.1 ankyrin repeat domain-containing protein [Burkholderia multivorans]MCO1448917.1 ankyrin repeat domain-containing protein [Burkholderia multivorans]
MGDRTVSEIEEEMDYHQEEGNLGAVMNLVDELGNMGDRLTVAITNGDWDDALYFESLGFDLREPFYLKIATKHRQCEIIKHLVQHGSDVHANGGEALCFAAEGGYLEAVQCLVELGANIHAQEDKPVKLATHANKIGVVQYLVEAGASIDAVLEITGDGNFYPELHKWVQAYKSKQTLEAELTQKEERTPKTKI